MADSLTAPAYDDLPEWEQELIQDARIYVGDLDTDVADRYLQDDEWTSVLAFAVKDFNKTQPYTNFEVDEFPEGLSGVLGYGLLYHFALARSNRYIEEVSVSGYQGPYVDRSQLWQRWNQRAMDLKPEWKSARNRAKLLFLPRGVGTVSSHSFGGQFASITPLLRGMPSWNYARG